MKAVCDRLHVPYIFKASYDKANCSSGKSVRGPGMDAGLRILLDEVRRQVGVPILTDVHSEEDDCRPSRPWSMSCRRRLFLCRQTDFIHAVVAACGRPVNIKKASSWRRAT